MTLPLLHFAHANGFPAGSYRVFFQHLSHRYTIDALDRHAHNPRYPVTDGWPHLVQELIETLEARYREPVILAGHSMGGLLSLMAVAQRPDLARCVVLLDAPLIAGWRAMTIRLAKAAGRDPVFSHAHLSQKRRERWVDGDAAIRHFAAKPVFASWPPEVLQDYVQAGTASDPDQGGVKLRFNRDVETALYRTIPHHLGKLVANFPVPAGYIAGDRSIEGRYVGTAAIRRLVGPHYQTISGGHLYPMESPALAADSLHRMIQSLLGAGNRAK